MRLRGAGGCAHCTGGPLTSSSPAQGMRLRTPAVTTAPFSQLLLRRALLPGMDAPGGLALSAFAARRPRPPPSSISTRPLWTPRSWMCRHARRPGQEGGGVRCLPLTLPCAARPCQHRNDPVPGLTGPTSFFLAVPLVPFRPPLCMGLFPPPSTPHRNSPLSPRELTPLPPPPPLPTTPAVRTAIRPGTRCEALEQVHAWLQRAPGRTAVAGAAAGHAQGPGGQEAGQGQAGPGH